MNNYNPLSHNSHKRLRSPIPYNPTNGTIIEQLSQNESNHCTLSKDNDHRFDDCKSDTASTMMSTFSKKSSKKLAKKAYRLEKKNIQINDESDDKLSRKATTAPSIGTNSLHCDAVNTTTGEFLTSSELICHYKLPRSPVAANKVSTLEMYARFPQLYDGIMSYHCCESLYIVLRSLLDRQYKRHAVYSSDTATHSTEIVKEESNRNSLHTNMSSVASDGLLSTSNMDRDSQASAPIPVSLLDMGCGTGRISLLLLKGLSTIAPQYRLETIIGYDKYPKMLRQFYDVLNNSSNNSNSNSGKIMTSAAVNMDEDSTTHSIILIDRPEELMCQPPETEKQKQKSQPTSSNVINLCLRPISFDAFANASRKVPITSSSSTPIGQYNAISSNHVKVNLIVCAWALSYVMRANWLDSAKWQRDIDHVIATMVLRCSHNNPVVFDNDENRDSITSASGVPSHTKKKQFHVKLEQMIKDGHCSASISDISRQRLPARGQAHAAYTSIAIIETLGTGTPIPTRRSIAMEYLVEEWGFVNVSSYGNADNNTTISRNVDSSSKGRTASDDSGDKDVGSLREESKEVFSNLEEGDSIAGCPVTSFIRTDYHFPDKATAEEHCSRFFSKKSNIIKSLICSDEDSGVTLQECTGVWALEVW